MKKIALLSLILFGCVSLYAQQYITRNGTIEFLSATPVENIQAVNKQVSSVLDFDKNQFAFLVPIKAFTFEKALMQEHFNENYMESDQFPNASFKGKIVGSENVDLSTDGDYRVKMAGTMNIHGTDREIEEMVIITVKNGNLTLSCNFILKPEDYAIKIPAGKKANIAESLDVTVLLDYDKK
jgi:hypothetical protein